MGVGGVRCRLFQLKKCIVAGEVDKEHRKMGGKSESLQKYS